MIMWGQPPSAVRSSEARLVFRQRTETDQVACTEQPVPEPTTISFRSPVCVVIPNGAFFIAPEEPVPERHGAVLIS
jgi:hypothetical protein